MSITFYYAPMSSATRIHWALEELGVPYEKVKMNLAAGDQRKPEYLALNPNGKVPLLVDDGVPIFESLAILLHLGEQYGVEKGLFPKEKSERARALRWMAWAQVTLADAATRLLRNTSERFPKEEQNEKAAASAKSELNALLGHVDEGLAGNEYLLGGGFTLVDLALAGYMPFFARLGADTSPYKNLQAWLARSTSRPALARAMMG